MAKDVEREECFLPQSLDDLMDKTPEQLRQIFDALDAHLCDLNEDQLRELRELPELYSRLMSQLPQVWTV